MRRLCIVLIVLLFGTHAVAQQCGPRGCLVPWRAAPTQSKLDQVVTPDQAKPDQTRDLRRVRAVVRLPRRVRAWRRR